MPIIFTRLGALIGPGAISRRKRAADDTRDEDGYCGGGIFIAILVAGAERTEDELRAEHRQRSDVRRASVVSGGARFRAEVISHRCEYNPKT